MEPVSLSPAELPLDVDPAFLEALPVGVYLCAADGSLVAFNRRAAELWGRSPRIGDPDELYCGSYRLFHLDGRPLPHAETPMAAALRTGESQRDLEVEIERPDGSRIVAIVNIEPIRDGAGRVVGAVNSFLDATPARDARRAAMAAERKVTDLLGALPVAVYTTDSEGRITYFNEAAAAFWGRRPVLGEERWCGSFRIYSLDGAEVALDECPMAVALREGRPVRDVECVVERPDGTRIPFLPFPTPLFDAQGDVAGAVNVLVDLSERMRGEHARQRLASIVESSSDAIVSKDLDGVIRSWNEGARKLFGYRDDEAIGRPVLMLIPDDRRNEEESILERIRRGLRVEPYDTVRRRQDGSLVEVSLSVSPVRDGHGRIVGASKIARDITDRRRAEHALERRAEEHAALFELADRLQRADSRHEVLDAGLAAITRALACARASILLFDESGVMRFAAWRGISAGYRAAVEGHTPWRPETPDPQPIVIEDLDSADLDDSLRTTIRDEGIRSLAFLPLVRNRQTIGKFMAYHDTPRAFTHDEIEAGITLARQLTLALERLRAEGDRRRTEEQRELLVAELNHRVKNTLAIVVSIARQTFGASGAAPGAVPAFEGRIRALGQTHTRLAETSWEGASLGAMLRDELAPYRGPADGRVRLEGEAITLAPRLAVSLGMAVHELATNAAKHGALSVPAGEVAVEWSVDPSTGLLTIDWRESGGPPVEPPERSGFGRLLLERALPSDLEGGVEMRFLTAGLHCRISVPWREDTAWSS